MLIRESVNFRESSLLPCKIAARVSLIQCDQMGTH